MAEEKREQRRDELERLSAFGDYRRMAEPRRVGALWQSYIDRSREGDKSVPTTNRTAIFRWAKEDKWEEQLAEEYRELLAQEQVSTLRAKKGQTHAMWAIMPEANRALLRIIQTSDDDAVVLRAVTALYDRVGFPVESRTAVAKRREDEAAEENAGVVPATPMPAGDNAEEWAKYYAASTT